MRAQALAELSVENALRRGLDDAAFELHYQPVVDLETRVVIAFEALVRWRHPERGLLLPGEFLEVAEDAHLMVPLGRLVIREACAFLARHPGAPWRVFVNVSPQQIGAADLAGVLATELAEAGVPARRLAVEITENGVLDAFGVSLRDMQRVSEQGVDLVMDDFGTGYSALSSLLAAPIAGVKLDRSFTARLGDGAGGDRITATVGNLVAGLGRTASSRASRPRTSASAPTTTAGGSARATCSGARSRSRASAACSAPSAPDRPPAPEAVHRPVTRLNTPCDRRA